MPRLSDEQLDTLTRRLAEWAGEYDESGQWPARSVDLIAEMGGARWIVPAEFGGDPLPHADILRAYEAMSAGCMSTSLIVTQRDGAVDLIANSPNQAMKAKHLPRLAHGDYHTTVGISQLTTSRRAGSPLVAAEPDGDGYRLSGMIPWATGAERATIIVTGAVLPDGRQILAVAPTDREGITVETPERLLTLTASRTSSVQCDNYRIEPEEVLRGPAERVLALRTPVKPLVASACGIGVAGAMRSFILSQKSGVRTYFQEVLDPLEQRFQSARATLYDAAEHADDPEFETPASDIRVLVNDVVIRMAAVAVTLGKGGGFLAHKPLQRQAREALFFLVWSTPASVQLETLVRLFPTADSGPLEPRPSGSGLTP